MKGLLLAWWICANGADATSTEVALRRPGVYEGNPLMRAGVVERVTLRSAAVVGTTVVFAKAYPHHPKIVGWLVAAGSAEFTVLALHNLQER